jgi:alkylhydroperoxidase/carboxymuconolactone decarboxylase family protein YurZ
LFDFAPAIDEYLKTHLFGDIFERDSVDWQSRELATAGAATGHQIRRLTCPRRLNCGRPCVA